MTSQAERKSRNKILALLSIAVLLIFFTSGCQGTVTRHQILTFFFTGVEPLEGEEKAVKAVTDRKKKRRPVKKIEFYVHGPRAANECHTCHESRRGAGKKNKKRSGDLPKLGETMPGKVADMRNICTDCHISKSLNSTITRELWLHGALVNGNCLSCHHYHQSRYPYILLNEKTVDLCARCHAEGFINKTEEHTSGEECISCHNPHVGNNRFLLRKDFDEVF